MSKSYHPSVGDIIIKSFINDKGVQVKRHPFIIVAVKDDLITAIDERAIFGGFAVSDYESTKSKSIIEELAAFEVIYADKKDGLKKKSIIQINSLTLFASDILPIDKQGEVNPDIVTRSLKLLNRLKKEGKLKINRNNLPNVVMTHENSNKLVK